MNYIRYLQNSNDFKLSQMPMPIHKSNYHKLSQIPTHNNLSHMPIHNSNNQSISDINTQYK